MTVAMMTVPFWPVIWTHSPQWLFESKPFWPGMAAKYVAEAGLMLAMFSMVSVWPFSVP